MIRDIELLEWIYARLINVHHGNKSYDYMIHLKELITRNKGRSKLSQGEELTAGKEFFYNGKFHKVK